jgi:two-component system, chemotaxis family, response regulator Rcp1
MDNGVLLYVEDDEATAHLLEAALNEAETKIQLYRVSDGEEALAFLNKSRAPYQAAPRPHLVLLDLNLPKRNGFEVLGEMRGSNTLSGIPVVVFTSSSAVSDRKKSLALGAKEYLTKPFDFDGFLETVKSISTLLSLGAALDSQNDI